MLLRKLERNERKKTILRWSVFFSVNLRHRRLDAGDRRHQRAIEMTKVRDVSGLLAAGIRFRHSGCADPDLPTAAKPAAVGHQSAVETPFWAWCKLYEGLKSGQALQESCSPTIPEGNFSSTESVIERSGIDDRLSCRVTAEHNKQITDHGCLSFWIEFHDVFCFE